MALYVPPKQALPVSKGGDLVIDFMQKVDDVYTNYGAGVVVRLEVDIQGTGRPPPPPTTVTGVGQISTYHAVCRIEFPVADTIPDGSLWRAVISYPTIPDSTEIVGMNGRIQRADGS